MAQFPTLWWLICYQLYVYIVMVYVIIKNKWTSRQKREPLTQTIQKNRKKNAQLYQGEEQENIIQGIYVDKIDICHKSSTEQQIIINADEQEDRNKNALLSQNEEQENIILSSQQEVKNEINKQLDSGQQCHYSNSESQIIITEDQQKITVKGFEYKKNQNHVSLSKQFKNDDLVLTEDKIEITTNNETIQYEFHYDECDSLQIKKKQVTYCSNGQAQVREFMGLSNQLKETSENLPADEPSQSPQIIDLEKNQTKPKIKILSLTNMETNIVYKYEPKPRPENVSIDIQEETWVKYNQCITRSLVDRCEGKQWLSNEIINVFTRYINKQNSSQFWVFRQDPWNKESLFRIYAFDVDTMGLLQAYLQMSNQDKREESLYGLWQRVLALGKYIFDIYEIVFFPINKNNTHWFLISAKIVQGEFQFEVYDSIRQDEFTYQKYFDMLTIFLRTFGLIEQYQKYTLSVNGQCAQQSNGYDCGVYVCKFIQSLTYQQNVQNIQQQGINEMRSFLKKLLSKNQDQ